MLDPSIIKAMIASGASVEMLGAVWIADATIEQEKLLAKRAAVRARVRRFRERSLEKDEQNQQPCNGYSALQSVTPFSYVEEMDVKTMYVEEKKVKEEATNVEVKEVPLKQVTVKQGAARETENPLFSKFWELYPNKVSRKTALKSFNSAICRASFEEIAAGLDKYIHKNDERAWCNPATWLNQDRWLDEPASVQLSAKPLSFSEAIRLNNRKIFHDLARQAREPDIDNCFEASELRSLGGPASEIVSTNKRSGYG